MLQNDLVLVLKPADGTERHGSVGVSPELDRLNKC
jgi:hypothetical protein